MKVKDLRNILYKLEDDEEVLLLNNQAPLIATNQIENAVIVQEPTEVTNLETGKPETKFNNKLVLTYNTRERGEK